MKNFRIKLDFVLELSSSAVKKITRTGKSLVRTNTKSLVESGGYLNLDKFEKEIIPVIKDFWDPSENGACIATALYRSIKNRDKVLSLIKSKTGIDVDVISGQEEAKLIGKAIMSEHPGRPLLVVDSGSMSTEICIWPEGYYKSYKNGYPLILEETIKNKLQKSKNLLIVVTGDAIYRMGGPILNPRVKLSWHSRLQEVLDQVGIHPVIGTISTPGTGLLL